VAASGGGWGGGGGGCGVGSSDSRGAGERAKAEGEGEDGTSGVGWVRGPRSYCCSSACAPTEAFVCSRYHLRLRALKSLRLLGLYTG
jgi:hypothetical protein